MYIAGHVASAYLVSRRLAGPPAVWLVIGTLAPDVIDKSQQWLGVTPYGRSVGHSVLLWITLTMMWLVIGRGSKSSAVLLGGSLHLAIDLVDDLVEGIERSGYAFSAWMGWPLTNPDMLNWGVPHLWPREEGIPTVLELATVVFTIVMWLRPRTLGARS